MEHKKLAILVGGGPAPGINSVISAAAIRAVLMGTEVIGVLDGFKWISRGDISKVTPLTIKSVSRIHFRGGSHIGISRDNPTKDPKLLENVVTSLLRLNVDKLLAIGGDDTAYSAYCIDKKAAGRIRVVHVPKTIDNDLDLPHGISTFGFQTARHVGAEILKNIMIDAKTTSRWYFVVTMGRKAGHLAMGIGKAAGATLTLIPEEFKEEKIRMKKVVDLIVSAIIKRLGYGRKDGVCVLAEGLVERLAGHDLAALEEVERDAHDNIRIAEINFGQILKSQVQKRLKEFGIKTTVVSKNIGYELRCADPIPFDMEYTRDLGYCAAEYLFKGGRAAMVSIQNYRFVPLYLSDIIDSDTGKMKVRMVDVNSEYYQIAKKYMIRLRDEDFSDPHELAKLATITNRSMEEFTKQFGYLLENQ